MEKTMNCRPINDSSAETVPEPEASLDRRELLAGGLAASLLGLSAGPAAATSGIGFVSGAQAQSAAAATPIGAPWWPSKWGKDDQAGASNHITAEKVLDALKLVKKGKVYEIGRVYESSMPKFGERAFTLRIPGNPTGGPLGTNRIVWNDEFLATEIGQVGTTRPRCASTTA
jgi:hypothetical protein